MKAAKETILLDWFEIKEEDLEQIIKSSFNVEELTISNCDVHCTKPLNFSISEKYRIKCISFEVSVVTFTKNERNSDWINSPWKFKNIVSAIANSGLKYSLKKINICGNSSLKRSKVKHMFMNQGMSHIDISIDY